MTEGSETGYVDQSSEGDRDKVDHEKGFAKVRKIGKK